MFDTPDIDLGARATGPTLRYILNNPANADGTPGGPRDLTGSTVVLKYQKRGTTDPVVTRNATVVGSSAPGAIDIDWGATGGAIPSGEYDARFEETTGSGRLIPYPDGPREDGTEFYWLHVAADFAS